MTPICRLAIASVDTAPVLERELAAQAGIGWVGKNTCVIHPGVGSWLLLGEIISTLPLMADEPMSVHCGTCSRCIDACPTHAITGPYQLDATKCISYLTIEYAGEIPEPFHQPIGDWLYGCDICQDVCPHNSKAPAATDATMQLGRITRAECSCNSTLGICGGAVKQRSLREHHHAAFG